MQKDNKNTLYIIVGLSLVLVFLALMYFSLSAKNGGNFLGGGPTITPTYRPLTFEEAAVNQAESDKQLGERLEKTYASYPWLDKLPLQSDKYFIYFDTSDKKFYGTLYVAEGSAEAKTIREQLLKDLNYNGIDTEKFQFVWDYEKLK